MLASRSEHKHAEGVSKTLTMPVGKFLSELKKSEKDSVFQQLAAKGRSTAATMLNTQKPGRVFNGYQSVVFISEDFLSNKLMPLVKKLSEEISTLSQEDKDELDLTTLDDQAKATLIKQRVTAIYQEVIDYLCGQFLDIHGNVSEEVAQQLLGKSGKELNSTSTICSLIENVSGYFSNDLLRVYALHSSQLSSSEEQEAKALSLNISDYLESMNGDVKEEAKRILQRCSLNKEKDIPTKEELIQQLQAKHKTPGYVPSRDELRAALKASINKPLFEAHAKYKDYLTKEFGLVAIAIRGFEDNFASKKEIQNKQDKADQPKSYQAQYVAERVALFNSPLQKNPLYHNQSYVEAEKPKSFTEGFVGWKRKALYAGGVLFAIGAVVATAGAALPLVVGAAAAVSAPLIGSGVVASFAGITSMAVATGSSDFIREKYRNLGGWGKAAVIGLSTVALIGLTIVTGGIALGVFAGLGFAAAVAVLVTAKIVGASTAVAVGGATIKAVSVPAAVAYATRKVLSSNAKMTQQLMPDETNAAPRPASPSSTSRSRSQTPSSVISRTDSPSGVMFGDGVQRKSSDETDKRDFESMARRQSKIR